MWLIVSHSLHLLFCWVLSILAVIWLVLMASYCGAIRIDSVSQLRFPFLSHFQVFWCELVFISCLKRPQGCFFPIFFFLFSSYCHSIVYRVVGIISHDCKSFLVRVFLRSLRSIVSMRQRVFEPLYWSLLFYFLCKYLSKSSLSSDQGKKCQVSLLSPFPLITSLLLWFVLFF